MFWCIANNLRLSWLIVNEAESKDNFVGKTIFGGERNEELFVEWAAYFVLLNTVISGHNGVVH